MWRSKRVPGPSPFAEMDAAKQAARAAGQAIIDLSIGTPDLQPPPEALQALKAAVDDPTTYKYCLKSQTMPLLSEACAWYKRSYGVQLNPASEALCLVGSQEGLAHLLMAVCDPGQGLLMMDVAYPSYFGAVHVAGLQPVFIPTNPHTFLPELDQVPQDAIRRCRAVLLNFPNNPTGASATPGFWQRVLAWASAHGLLLIHDNPYVGQDYACEVASSPLALPGGRERCVELFSFAKSYQLGGFRLGFALGNADAIAALEALKGPIDFNQYLGIQRMGIACLRLPAQRVQEYAQVFCQRAEALVGELHRMDWNVAMPRACMYVWCRLPAGLDDMLFCQWLVAKTGVAVSPGRGFGPGGFGYVRFALVQPAEVLVQCARCIEQFLHQHGDALHKASAEAGMLKGVTGGGGAPLAGTSHGVPSVPSQARGGHGVSQASRSSVAGKHSGAIMHTKKMSVDLTAAGAHADQEGSTCVMDYGFTYGAGI